MKAAARVGAALLAAAAAAGCGGGDERRDAVLARLQAEARASNAPVRIAYDPERHLVSAPPEAARLIYERGPALVHAREHAVKDARHFAWRRVGAEFCRGQVEPLRAWGVRGGPEKADGTHPGPGEAAAACRLEFEEAPDGPTLRIEDKSERVTVDGIKLVRFVVTLRAPDGAEAQLLGWAKPARNLYGPISTGAPEETWLAAVRAMGLPAEPHWGARPVLGDAEARTAVTRFKERLIAEQQALIDRLIGPPTPEAPFTDPALPMLLSAPEVISPYADRLLEAWASEHAAPGGDGTRLEHLGDLLAALPAAEFERRAPRILQVMLRGGPLTDYPSERLIPRLGELGRPAAPLLMRIAAEQRPDEAFAPGFTAAACHVGAAAADSTGPLLLAHWTEMNEPVPRSSTRCRRHRRHGRDKSWCYRPANVQSTGELTYVALLRIGWREQAEAASRHLQKDKMRRKHLAVGPDTAPAAVCGTTWRPGVGEAPPVEADPRAPRVRISTTAPSPRQF